MSILSSTGQTFNAYIENTEPLPKTFPCPDDIKVYRLKSNVPYDQVKSFTNTEWEVTDGEIVDGGETNDRVCHIRWFDKKEGFIHIDQVIVETNSSGTYSENNVEMPVYIRSLNGVVSSSISGNTQVNMSSTDPIVFSSEIMMYGTDEVVSYYSWTIPPDWLVNGVVSSGSNVYVTTTRYLTVTPDDCTGGQIKVWAENSRCEGFLASNIKTLDISRTLPNLEIDGSSVICNSASYQINNPPSGSSITWDASSNITRTGTQGSNPCSFSSSNFDYGYIKAAINVCNSSFDLPDKLVRLNGPSYSDIGLELKTTSGSPVSFMCPNTHYHLFIQNSFGSCSLSNYTWFIPSGWTTNYEYNNMISIYTNSSPGGMVEVNANTCCGINHKVITDYYGGGYCGGYYMVMSPNPADSYVELAFIDSDDNKTKEDKLKIKKNKKGELGDYSVKILDKTGNVLKTIQDNNLNLRINTSDLKSGTYFLHLITSEEIYKQQLIIK